MTLNSLDDVHDALATSKISAADLYRIFEQRQPVPEARRLSKGKVTQRQISWLQDDPNLAVQFTKRALEKEEFLLVCDVAKEAIRYLADGSPQERTQLVRIKMNYATALTRLGFTREARQILEPCVADDADLRLTPTFKADIYIRLGNILRAESRNAAARAVQLRTAEDALNFYKRALVEDPDRIDALALTAAALLVLGDEGSPHRLEAKQIGQRLLDLTARMADSEATRQQARATAFAVLGDVESAAKCYGELKLSMTTTELADARFYASFIAEALGKPRDFFKPNFPPLQLVVFAGHLPDLPGNPVRFPRESIEEVRASIRRKLDEMDARVALVSAAAGADLLFVEAMLDRKGTVHLVLPWSSEEFLKTSVLPYETPGEEPYWLPKYERAMKESASIRAIGQAYEPSSDVGWVYMMDVTAGLALHTGRMCRLDVQPLVLWDGERGYGAGGTASFVQFWRSQLKQTPVRIELPALACKVSYPSDADPYRWSTTRTMPQEVKSMLFADVVGYSKLPEPRIPDFVDKFLGRVSQLLASSRHAPSSVNTWGDGLYAIFDSPRDAGLFALELVQMVAEGEKEWRDSQLTWDHLDPETGKMVSIPLNIRVGLHAGPVFRHFDPVVRRLGFTGAHVSRAARIEPIANPGDVFASEEFAALSELDNEIRRKQPGDGDDETAGFVCEYAGSKDLAKDFPGKYRIYRVMPRRVFAIEELARAAHESFIAEAKARGETPESNPSMRLWVDLTEDLKQANRAQVSDIPNKLRELGYELAPAYGLSPSEIKMTDQQIEELSIREHDRWMNERRNQGWTYAHKRDNRRKHHPLLIPWEKLSEPEKEKDRDTVRNLPLLIERAGFRVKKLT
jgi:class 3 adenylate cyclase/tetratricopeptide (TPR) repeat protein